MWFAQNLLFILICTEWVKQQVVDYITTKLWLSHSRKCMVLWGSNDSQAQKA